MSYIITSKCTNCDACTKVCPVECIAFKKDDKKWPHYYIDPQTCIECGACAPECPVGAIHQELEVPEDNIEDIKQNYEFFEEGPGYEGQEEANNN